MKNNLFKTIACLAVFSAGIILSGCGTSRKAVIGSAAEAGGGIPLPASAKPTYSSSPASAAVSSALDNKDFYIEIERIVPKKMPPKETLDGYTISIKDNTLNCYLPYIGEVRYSFTNDNAIAIDAKNVPVNMKVTMNPPHKNCYAFIEFTFKSKYNSEIFYFMIDLYKNGTSYIKVESQYRDLITYTGRLEARPEPKQK